LAEARALLRADQALRPLARSGLMPRLQVAAGVSRNEADIEGFGTQDLQEAYRGENYSVTLRQPLFDGQAWTALRAADSRIRGSEAALLAAEQDLILDVARAYFGSLGSGAAERVARGQRDLLRNIFRQTEAFLKAGTGDIIALHEAKARLDAAEADLIQAENADRMSTHQLQRLLHRPPKELDDLGTVQALGPEPSTVEPWVEAAMENQPILIGAREQMRAAEDDVEIARRARWPNLEIESGYMYDKGGFLPDLRRREARIGIVFSMPIYQGGEISARVRQAEAWSEASRNRLDGLRDRIRLETEDAFLLLQDSVARLDAARQTINSAGTALYATQDGYALGTRSLIDLMNAVQAHAAAQRSLFQARYDHVVARLGLKAAAGILCLGDLEDVNVLLAPAGPAREP